MSYEISLGPVTGRRADSVGQLQPAEIVDSASRTWFHIIPKWNIFQGQFVAFFIYLMAAYAETNRIPFDLAGSGD